MEFAKLEQALMRLEKLRESGNVRSYRNREHIKQILNDNRELSSLLADILNSILDVIEIKGRKT